MSSVESTLSPVAAALAAADEVLPATLGGELWRTGADELDQALGDVRVLEARLAGLRVAMVREAEVRGLRERTSAPSTVAWLRDRFALDLAEANAEVELATMTRADGPAPQTGVALAAGRISEARARTMLTVLESLPAPLPADLVGQAEAQLLEVASYGDTTAPRSAGQTVARALTPFSEDGPEPREPELQNEFRLSRYRAGWWRAHGLLDSEHAAAISTILDLLSRPGRQPTGKDHTGSPAGTDPGDTADRRRPGSSSPGGADPDDLDPQPDGPTWPDTTGPDDPDHHSGQPAGPCSAGPDAYDRQPGGPTPDTRDVGERWADALAELCAGAVRASGAPTHGGMPTTLVVTMTLAELLAGLGGSLPNGDRLSAADTRRMCCDTGVVPAVLGGPGEVLDLGHQTRVVSPAIRRALDLRDGGCAFPGCPARPVQCDAHHVQHWADGGATTLGNLCLLCPHHHRRVHRQAWTLNIGPDGVTWTPPVSVDPVRAPRQHIRMLIHHLPRPTYVRPDRR